MVEMMDGPWTAKSFIRDYLAADVPERLNGYRNRWQLDDSRLPDPVLYAIYEPPALDQWPCIYTIQANAPSFERIDYTAVNDPVYRVTYNMRTYVWVRDFGDVDNDLLIAHQVTEARDRLVAVVRSSLLDHPSMLKTQNLYFPSLDVDVRLDETTLTEEYSDITYVKGNRAIAGAYLGYEFACNEIIARANIADSLEQVNVEVVPLGWEEIV